MNKKNYNIKYKDYKHSSLFIGQSYFFYDGEQLYLIFQTFHYTLKRLGNTEKNVSWKSTDNSLSPSIRWYENSNFCLVFKESCLKQENATYTPPNRMTSFIVYELDTWSRDLHSDFTLKDWLFG